MKSPTRLYCIRHGQVTGYLDSPVVGHTDVPLTEVGRLQMVQMAERLRHVEIQAIYGSDLQRSVEGARHLARYHNVPLYLLPGFREMFFGDWEGLSLSRVREAFPQELAERERDPLHFAPPGGGESLLVFSERILEGLEALLEKEQGKTVALVGHAGVNRVLLCHALGLDMKHMFRLDQGYGCLNILEFYEKWPFIKMMNG